MNDATYVVAIIPVRRGGSTVALVRQNVMEVLCLRRPTKLLIYPREAQKYFDGDINACMQSTPTEIWYLCDLICWLFRHHTAIIAVAVARSASPVPLPLLSSLVDY